jgi:hypothetical protein
MRAEVWSSIANGAKGIGYFTIGFGRGTRFEWMNLTPEMQAAMRDVNGGLRDLSGPIVAGVPKPLVVSDDRTSDEAAKAHAINAMRREYDGKTWIIAVNVTRQKVRPVFELEDAASPELKVWRERRVLPVVERRFSDDFEPLAVHIYTDGDL